MSNGSFERTAFPFTLFFSTRKQFRLRTRTNTTSARAVGGRQFRLHHNANEKTCKCRIRFIQRFSVRSKYVEQSGCLNRPHRRINPCFSLPIFHKGWQAEQMQAGSSNGESSQDQATISKKQTLEDLYRPPLDIMYRGSLEAVSDFELVV